MEETSNPRVDVQHKYRFNWSNESVIEFARDVAQKYKSSEIWTSDLSIERDMLRMFIKRKEIEEKLRDVIISDAGKTLIVDKDRFEGLMDFLIIYRDIE